MKQAEEDEEKKKMSTIEAYKKDETFYRKHQVERLKKAGKHEKKENANETVEKAKQTVPPAPKFDNKYKEVKLPNIELVVVDLPILEKTASTSVFEPIEEATVEEAEQDPSKNYKSKETRKSLRKLSTSHDKT